MYNPVMPNMFFCSAVLNHNLYGSALNTANAMTRNTVQASTQNAFSNLQTMNQQANGAYFIDRSVNIDNAPISQIDIKYLENAYFMQTVYDHAISQLKAPKKKHLTIYDLNRLIFPEDPIRDWVEKKTAEIEKKFAWADQL